MSGTRKLTLNVVLKYLQECLDETAACEGPVPWMTYKFGPLDLWIPYHVKQKGIEMQNKYNFTRDFPWQDIIQGLRDMNLWPHSLGSRMWDPDWAHIFKRMEDGEDRGGHSDVKAFRIMFTIYQFCSDLITSSIHADDLVGYHLANYPAPPNIERVPGYRD